MMFIELALQGIRGFPRLHRLAIRPGLNVARTVDPRQRRTLFDLLYHTLYPDPSRGQATTALADPGASQSRVSLTFYGRDKQGYRIIRDTVTGATKLYRYDAGDKRYRLFSEVSTEAAQFVRVQQQLPDEVVYERLFMFDPQQMPSRAGRARTRSGAPLASGAASPAASPPRDRLMSGIMSKADSHPPEVRADSHLGGIGSAMNYTNALVQEELESPRRVSDDVVSDADKRAQLERMKADLAIVVRAEAAQVELDRVQSKRSEVARLAQRHRALRAELGRLEAQLNPAFADLGDGAADRIRTFQSRERRFKAERLKLVEERDRLLDEADDTPQLATDRYFLVGVGGAAACLAAGTWVQLPGLALANLPFAVVAVGSAFKWVNELEERHKVRKKAYAIGKQLERLERAHDLDTAATRKLMKVLGTDDTSGLIDEVEADGAVRADVARVREELERLDRDPAAAGADRELKRLDASVERLETEIIGASGSQLSADQLRRRIRSLERELGLPPAEFPASPPPPDPLMASGGESSFVRAADIPTADVPDPLSWLENSTATGDLTGSFRALPVRGRSLPPMPAPGEALPPTPDIPVARRPRETSVPGVVAHRSSAMTLSSDLRRPTSSLGSQGARPSRPAFDFSDRPVGDDEEDDDGYGSGYGHDDADRGRRKDRGRGRRDDTGRGRRGDGGAQASGGFGGWSAVGIGGGGFGGLGGGGGYGMGSGSGDDALPPDRSRDLIQAAIDLLQVRVDDLGASLAPRLGQYLTAFTDKRIRRAEFGPRGEVRVAGKKGDFVPYPQLEDEALDLVDASIKMALVEMVVRQYRIPVLLDDPFVDFPKARRVLVGQMLAYLASATQVIIATPVEDLQGHSVDLGR